MGIDAKSGRLSKDKIEALLLHKFVIKGAWHEYHIYESDIPKGFPPPIRKDVMRAAYDLRKRGFLRSFPHGKEHVWILNKSMSKEIVSTVRQFFPEEYPE
jgi:hypothetical protein